MNMADVRSHNYLSHTYPNIYGSVGLEWTGKIMGGYHCNE